MREFGKVDILVNNAAYQMNHETLEEISDEEWAYTFKCPGKPALQSDRERQRRPAPGVEIGRAHV